MHLSGWFSEIKTDSNTLILLDAHYSLTFGDENIEVDSPLAHKGFFEVYEVFLWYDVDIICERLFIEDMDSLFSI